VGSTGRKQPVFRAGNPGGVVSCDAKCVAISADRVELLARSVALVAGMNWGPDAITAQIIDVSRFAPDVWKQAHPEAVRICRAEEWLSRADAKQAERARRRAGKSR
jgi:hypothetical protein